MPQVVRAIDVEVTPAQFRAVLDDYARYPDFLAEVKSVKLGPGDGARLEVTYRLDVVLKTFEYTLEHTSQGPLRVDWKLVKGEFLRENTGHWLLEPLVNGGTRATYTIALKLAPGLPATVETVLAEQGLPRLLSSFKARAESLYKRPG